jgi:pentatricopeptide repeat protein
MDYYDARLVENSSPSDTHCQKQSFQLDASAQKYFFSFVTPSERKVERVKQAIASMEDLREFKQSGGTINLDDLARRVIGEFPDLTNPLSSRSNPMKGRIIVKQQVVDFIQTQLDQLRTVPITIGARLSEARKTSLTLLRLRRDCAREIFFESIFGRECLENGINMEPHWANGAPVFVHIQNPWALPVNLTFEHYHVLIAEHDRSRLEQSLRDALPYKRRPRMEVEQTFHFEHEDTTEIMTGYADMLRNGCDVDMKTFTRLIHMCCKKNHYKDTFTLLHEMEVKGIHPSEVTCNCILKAFHQRCPKKADKFVTRMTERWGLQPTKLAYDVVIKAYKKQRNFGKAEEWETKAASHHPDNFDPST